MTTQYRLAGNGAEGVGEDVGLFNEDSEALHAEGPYLDLAGEWTLGSFVEHLATVDQWKVAPPEWEMARAWRNWAFESAALDLALRQAEQTLPEALAWSRPLRFVNSLGLGDPPSRRGSPSGSRRTRRSASSSTPRRPGTTRSWRSRGVGCVATVDFKGRYGLPVEDDDALVAMYRTCWRRSRTRCSRIRTSSPPWRRC